MQMLSIGMPSTLGSYQKLCNIFFGEDSAQAKFINEKIATNPNGADEEVIAEESQMMYLLMHIEDGSKASLESML